MQQEIGRELTQSYSPYQNAVCWMSKLCRFGNYKVYNSRRKVAQGSMGWNGTFSMLFAK